MCGQTGHDTRLPPSFVGKATYMYVTGERSLGTQLHGSSICMAYLYFEMLSMGVCTTRRCRAFGRPLEELHVFTVHKSLSVV